MKDSITTHFLGTKGYADKKIKNYYRNLKSLRRAINNDANLDFSSEFMYELEGGLRFFFQEWKSTAKNHRKIPKKIIFAFHEAYGSSDTFYPLADFLNPLDGMVVSLDYRGHGRTGGQAGGNIGDLESFNSVCEDFEKLIIEYKNKYDLPMFFVGYDIGALVAMQTLLKLKNVNIEGIILISPLIKLKSNLKHLLLYPLITIGQIFSKGNKVQDVFPEIIRKTYFNEYKIYSKENPIRLKKMSLRLFKNILNLINSSSKQAKKINIPILILQSTDDSLVDHFAVHKLYKKWHHPNKFIRFYENAGHNLLVDKYTLEIYKEIAKFCGL